MMKYPNDPPSFLLWIFHFGDLTASVSWTMNLSNIQQPSFAPPFSRNWYPINGSFFFASSKIWSGWSLHALTESSSHKTICLCYLKRWRCRLDKINCYQGYCIYSLCMSTKDKYNFTRNWFSLQCTRLVHIGLKLVSYQELQNNHTIVEIKPLFLSHCCWKSVLHIHRGRHWYVVIMFNTATLTYIWFIHLTRWEAISTRWGNIAFFNVCNLKWVDHNHLQLICRAYFVSQYQ